MACSSNSLPLKEEKRLNSIIATARELVKQRIALSPEVKRNQSEASLDLPVSHFRISFSKVNYTKTVSGN